jgi:hypothetical protein
MPSPPDLTKGISSLMQQRLKKLGSLTSQKKGHRKPQTRPSSRKLLMQNFQMNLVEGSYDFIAQLMRIAKSYKQFETLVWALDMAVISVAIYAVMLLIGLPAFTRFYWQGFYPLQSRRPFFR